MRGSAAERGEGKAECSAWKGTVVSLQQATADVVLHGRVLYGAGVGWYGAPDTHTERGPIIVWSSAQSCVSG